jgi:hypothetical protein
MSVWTPTCKEIGGPFEPTLETCGNQDSGCDAFKESFCIYSGDPLEVNENVLTPVACQVYFCLSFVEKPR